MDTVKEVLEFETPKEESKIIYYKRDGILFSLQTKDIVYVENRNRYIEYHCTDGVHKAPYASCKSIIQELGDNNFAQCNKHVVVNMNYILSIDSVNRYIKLINNYGELEIGPRLKKEFMSRLKNE